MADFAVDLAKPALERVRDGIIGHVSYSLFAGDKVAALESQVERLKAKRRDVEDTIEADEPAGKVATMEAERWLESAAQLEKEAESIINEYRDRSCVLCRNFSINLWSNHSISVRAIEVKTKVVDELSSLTNIHQITKRPPPPVAQLVSTGSTLGAETGSEIKTKVDEVLGFLSNSPKGMLGIWGMGGVGKTTVLNHVNNELLARGPSLGLHRVVLVTASRECTVEKLQSLMVKALKLTEVGDQKNSIFNFLRNKNFVILLDDLWEPLDLDQVGVPHLGVSGEFKQKLILTTRSHQVCVDMDVRHTIKVDCLCRERARRLFREKVGEEVINSHPLISSKLADEVADECDGLPIALITIARSMADKIRVSDWMNAIKDLRQSKTNSGIDDPLQLLKISYDFLKDPSLQECLLLCALWPEDYNIPINKSIDCWMGHGLLGEFDTVGEAYENGRKIIDKLVKASLLERHVGYYFEGTVSLHDLIRDMALWIARDNGANERKWVVLSGVGSDNASGDRKSWKGAHKVSLMRNNMTRLPSNVQSAHNLNTLMLQENGLPHEELEVVRNFHQLKYLDLSFNNLHCFPPAICQLNELEYLNLSLNYITSLPVELKELTRLKYLLLKDNRISEVPSELFSSLHSLEVLALSSYKVRSQSLIIDNLDCCLKGRLKGLSINACSQTDLDKLGLLSVPIQTLYRYIAVEEGSTSLQLLPRPNRPNDLTWSELDSLFMYGEGGGNKIEELVIDQYCHGSLPNSLIIQSCSYLKEIVWSGMYQNDVIPMLRTVIITFCANLQHLSWLVNLPLLEALQVGFCVNLKQLIRKEEAEEEIERVGNKPAVVTLYSLRLLSLTGLAELETICNCTLHLPSLEHLIVLECERLKKLPFDTPASCSKLKEIDAKKKWWDSTLEMGDDMRTHLQCSCSLTLGP